MQSTLSALCLVVILRFGRESEGDQSEERSFSSLSWSDECSKAFRGKGSFLYYYYYFNRILYIDAVESHQHSSKKLELPKCPGFLFFQQWPVKEKCNSSTSIYSKVMTRIDLFLKKKEVRTLQQVSWTIFIFIQSTETEVKKQQEEKTPRQTIISNVNPWKTNGVHAVTHKIILHTWIEERIVSHKTPLDLTDLISSRRLNHPWRTAANRGTKPTLNCAASILQQLESTWICCIHCLLIPF